MTTEIQLTQGITALVDDEDFERVSQFEVVCRFHGHPLVCRKKYS